MPTETIPPWVSPTKVELVIPQYLVNNKYDTINTLKPYTTKTISNVANGGLDLIFDNVPTKLLTIIRCDGLKTFNDGGYIELYDWYVNKLNSGNYPFTIDSDHYIWKICSYKERFLKSTKATHFKVTNFPALTQGDYNGIATWKMTIKPEVF